MLGYTNISTTVVGTTLGVNTHKVSELCASDRINMWSLRKPIAFAKNTGLTDQDYLDANYGFIITSQNNYSSLKTAITNKQGWRYDKPTGGANAPYRLGDFRGYNHTATELFPLTISGSPGLDKSLQISCPTDLSSLTKWGEWQSYQGTNMQSLNAGFYIPSIGYFPLTDTDQGLTIADLDSEKLSIQLSSSAGFTVGRNYEVYLILTTWDGRNGARQWYNPSDTEGGFWWYLPSSKAASFTVIKPPTPADYVYVTTSGTATITERSNYTAWSDIWINYSIRVTNDYPYSNGTVALEGNFRSHYPGSGTSTVNKLIYQVSVTGISAGVTKTGSVRGSDFNVLNSKDDYANLTTDIRLTLGSETYTKQQGTQIIGS